MITLIRADLVRLTSLRSSIAVPLSLFALVAGITVASLSESGSKGMSTASQLREPLTGSAGIMVAVTLALFAATQVAGEYRYGTISQRLLASPRRWRLLVATLTVYGLFGLAVGAAGLGIGSATAQPMLVAESASMSMTPQIVAAVLLAVVSFSLIGVCCALIVRSQPAAVLVIVGTFVAEKLLGMFIGNAAAYLPYGLLTPLLQLQGATITAGVAATALVTITVAVVAVAFAVFTRRDVTP